jgi:hypothetical protein
MKLNLAQLANNLQVEPKNMKFLEKKLFLGRKSEGETKGLEECSSPKL